MSIVVYRNRERHLQEAGALLIRFVLNEGLLAKMALDRFQLPHGESTSGKDVRRRRNSPPVTQQPVVAMPHGWTLSSALSRYRHHYYDARISLEGIRAWQPPTSKYFAIYNGRFVLDLQPELFSRVLSVAAGDILAINLRPELFAYREKLKSTSDGHVAGLRRFYEHTFEPTPIPGNWPHLVLVRTRVAEAVSRMELTSAFPVFVNKCQRQKVRAEAFDMAGFAADLASEAGILSLWHCDRGKWPGPGPGAKRRKHRARQSAQPRIHGLVSIGKGTRIGANTIIVGPSLIADNVELGEDTLVDSSIIGPGLSLSHVNCIRHRVIVRAEGDPATTNGVLLGEPLVRLRRRRSEDSCFREWPRYSYMRLGKRLGDILASLLAIVLLLPIVPLIALAIKMNSRGPVFFRARRQGLDGKEFDCLKFRTMRVGADALQEKLQAVNEVDGPQFKMEDDPRISAVGRFLRETYLDEIPQFWNVLMGEMSLVGPRPSPTIENTGCPRWRDARLSVRPGVTGLWQLLRTRSPNRDFQEWIKYDIEYVRTLSFRTDASICWRTIVMMSKKFVKQF